jgi:hypothetical protein
MKKHKFVAFVFSSPFLLTGILCSLKFQIDSGNTVSVFLSFVWGIMFALGGAIVFLEKLTFSGTTSEVEFQEKAARRVVLLSFSLILHSLIFIFLCLAFIAKEFLIEAFYLTGVPLTKIACLAESALFSFIAVPSIGSVIVGGWCLSLSVSKENPAQPLKPNS